MKKVTSVLFLLSVVFANQACNSNNRNVDNTDTVAVDSVDGKPKTLHIEILPDSLKDAKAFIDKATVGGMMEIELGKLASKNSKSSQVKDFANLMVKDHGKAADELSAIAKKKNIAPPTSLPPKEQEHLDELKKLLGSEFDKHYMGMMVDDHKDAVDLFKSATSNPDADVSSFATKMLPVIESHYAKAKALKDRLK